MAASGEPVGGIQKIAVSAGPDTATWSVQRGEIETDRDPTIGEIQ